MISALESLRIRYAALRTVDGPVDIWIRDWGPVAGFYFRYNPSYARGLHTSNAVKRARNNLNRYLGSAPREISLVLEGGNLIHNGRVAIVTEKVLADNPQFSHSEIERLICSIGFERTLFIPVEPDDNVGHADGIVRFLAPDLLLVNDYRGRDFAAYRKKLHACLRNAKLGAEIVPFPWFSTDEKHEGVWSAVGCYINFVLTSRGIIFPTFSHPLDEKVAVLLNELSPLPKRSVESTALARLGGVLNCATLTV
jgi:agmatine deiminase